MTTESNGAAAPNPGPEDGAAQAAEDCVSCLTARGIVIAAAFAAFAAFVAADFATGGRLTTAALGMLATLRGLVPGTSEGAEG
jgi:hypothetical protein